MSRVIRTDALIGKSNIGECERGNASPSRYPSPLCEPDLAAVENSANASCFANAKGLIRIIETLNVHEEVGLLFHRVMVPERTCSACYVSSHFLLRRKKEDIAIDSFFRRICTTLHYLSYTVFLT